MSKKLQNYLRTYRKRAGLSQEEMAFLLGCRSGTKVSRYECFARQPTLQNAFVYEVVFRMHLREMFGGVYQKVEQKTLKRARLLVQKLERAKRDHNTDRKLNALKAIASRPTTELDVLL
jgi:transcriptional regulator with XRE-family HTH domain